MTGKMRVFLENEISTTFAVLFLHAFLCQDAKGKENK